MDTVMHVSFGRKTKADKKLSKLVPIICPECKKSDRFKIGKSEDGVRIKCCDWEYWL